MAYDLSNIIIVWRFVLCLELSDAYEELQFKAFARCSHQKRAKQKTLQIYPPIFNLLRKER